jgi:biopolymer transport protein ExbD
MSKSSSSDADTEPDLTAMLDMVMQLLMFFIICAGIIKSEKNEDVKLPRSDEAHLIDAVDRESYFINLVPFRLQDVARRIPATTSIEQEERERQLTIIKNLFQEGDPCVIVPGDPMPKKPTELGLWLQDKAELAQRTSPDGKIHKVIVMRADRNLDYALVFRLLKLCKANGFRELKLRALIPEKK